MCKDTHTHKHLGILYKLQKHSGAMQGVPMRPHNALFLGESRPVPSTFGSKLRITEKPESNQKSDAEIANRLSSNAIPAKKWKMRMSLKPGFLLCDEVATLHRTAPTAQGMKTRMRRCTLTPTTAPAPNRALWAAWGQQHDPPPQGRCTPPKAPQQALPSHKHQNL